MWMTRKCGRVRPLFGGAISLAELNWRPCAWVWVKIPSPLSHGKGNGHGIEVNYPQYRDDLASAGESCSIWPNEWQKLMVRAVLLCPKQNPSLKKQGAADSLLSQADCVSVNVFEVSFRRLHSVSETVPKDAKDA